MWDMDLHLKDGHPFGIWTSQTNLPDESPRRISQMYLPYEDNVPEGYDIPEEYSRWILYIRLGSDDETTRLPKRMPVSIVYAAPICMSHHCSDMADCSVPVYESLLQWLC